MACAAGLLHAVSTPGPDVGILPGLLLLALEDNLCATCVPNCASAGAAVALHRASISAVAGELLKAKA